MSNVYAIVDEDGKHYWRNNGRGYLYLSEVGAKAVLKNHVDKYYGGRGWRVVEYSLEYVRDV